MMAAAAIPSSSPFISWKSTVIACDNEQDDKKDDNFAIQLVSKSTVYPLVTAIMLQSIIPSSPSILPSYRQTLMLHHPSILPSKLQIPFIAANEYITAMTWNNNTSSAFLYLVTNTNALIGIALFNETKNTTTNRLPLLQNYLNKQQSATSSTDTSSFRQNLSLNNTTSIVITSIVHYKENIFFIGTHTGQIFQIKDNTIIVIKDSIISDNNIKTLEFYNQTHLVISTTDEYYYYYNLEEQKIYKTDLQFVNSENQIVGKIISSEDSGMVIECYKDLECLIRHSSYYDSTAAVTHTHDIISPATTVILINPSCLVLIYNNNNTGSRIEYWSLYDDSSTAVLFETIDTDNITSTTTTTIPVCDNTTLLLWNTSSTTILHQVSLKDDDSSNNIINKETMIKMLSSSLSPRIASAYLNAIQSPCKNNLLQNIADDFIDEIKSRSSSIIQNVKLITELYRYSPTTSLTYVISQLHSINQYEAAMDFALTSTCNDHDKDSVTTTLNACLASSSTSSESDEKLLNFISDTQGSGITVETLERILACRPHLLPSILNSPFIVDNAVHTAVQTLGLLLPEQQYQQIEKKNISEISKLFSNQKENINDGDHEKGISSSSSPSLKVVLSRVLNHHCY